MTTFGDKNIWLVKLPEKFGEPPKRMSTTSLKEIESCPHRYALRRAEYQQIWNGFGYPSTLTLKALKGVIVHTAIETIIRALRQTHCPSIDDELFVKTMRSLNGYSGVLEKQLNVVLNQLNANPRLSHKVDQITDKLRDSFPLLREQIQSQLSKLKLSNQARAKDYLSSDKSSRSLSNGIHSEIELNASKLGWYGKVDYLSLSADGCEIVDFKTGARNQEHIFQLKIYNMLWLLDEKQNPNSTPVNKLTISYKIEDLQIAPLKGLEMDDFINEVKDRTESAILQILQPIPEARPSIDNCGYCSVRQLCSAYWTQNTQKSLMEEYFAKSFPQKNNKFDVEVELKSSIAEYIWYVRTIVCSNIELGTDLIIRFTKESLQIPVKLKSGVKLRILNVSLLEHMNEESSVQTLATSWQSEVFSLENL